MIVCEGSNVPLPVVAWSSAVWPSAGVAMAAALQASAISKVERMTFSLFDPGRCRAVRGECHAVVTILQRIVAFFAKTCFRIATLLRPRRLCEKSRTSDLRSVPGSLLHPATHRIIASGGRENGRASCRDRECQYV